MQGGMLIMTTDTYMLVAHNYSERMYCHFDHDRCQNVGKRPLGQQPTHHVNTTINTDVVGKV